MDKADSAFKQPKIFFSAHLCRSQIGFDDVDIYLIIFRDDYRPIYARFIHDDMAAVSSFNDESGLFENFYKNSIVLRG